MSVGLITSSSPTYSSSLGERFGGRSMQDGNNVAPTFRSATPGGSPALHDGQPIARHLFGGMLGGGPGAGVHRDATQSCGGTERRRGGDHAHGLPLVWRGILVAAPAW